jgi:hypothetical protein
MTNDDYVDKILAGFFQSAARRQHFGEPREPSLTCEICKGTGWDVSDDGKVRMQFRCCCCWPKPN